MSGRAKRVVVTIASPLILGILKLQTKLTGRQRARVVVLNRRGQLLLVHEIASNRWSLPGGGIEKSETPVDAAVRELREELGLLVDSSRLKLLQVLQKPQTNIDYVAHIFIVTIVESEIRYQDINRRELIDVAWFDSHTLPSKVSGVTRAVFELLSKTNTI